jgi:predicted molibdopterin-dependent oxidoreductase YjgC
MTKSAVRVKTLTIDGREVGAREDQTILEVARENSVFVPTLCDLPGLTAPGACRLCLVEVKGLNKLLPACLTRIAEGMEVTVNSDRLTRYRRGILELLFAERNHVCSVCVTNGQCDLQSLAMRLGATGHNNAAMNRGVLQVARHFVHGDRLQEAMLNRVEAVIRAFDPCLSCSTHADGRLGLEIELRSACGELLDVLR